MKSPFAIFRKNQKLMMVLLTFMAMIAFVFFDQVGRGPAGGARGGEVVVKMNSGDINAVHLSDMVRRREIANRFVREAYVAANEESRLNEFQLQNMLFSYGRPPRQDVIVGEILRQEARRLGIHVSDEAVEAYIDQVTDRKLSTQQFRDILSAMQLSRKEVYDCLRDELLSRLAFQTEAPQNPQPPDAFWKFYRQLKVQQRLEVAGIPVKEFVAQVPKPDEATLRRYFEQHKNRIGDLPPDYEPGFRQPRRVRLQELGATYEGAEKLVPEVTDAEVTEYYEKNKDALYREPASLTTDETPLDPDFAPEGTDPKQPGAEKPDAENSDADKSADSAQEKPAADDTPEAKKPDAKPATEDADKEEAKPESEDPPAKKPEAKKPEAKKPAPPSKPQSSRPRNAVRQLASGETGGALFAVQDDAAQEDAAKEKPESKPAAPAKESKPAAEDKPAAAAKEATPADAKPAPAKAPAAAKAGAKKDGVKKADAKSDKDPDAEAPPPPPAPTYKPLDDALRDQIRDELLRQRTLDALKVVADHAIDAITQLGLEFNRPPSADGNFIYLDLNDNGARDANEPTIKTPKPADPDKLTPEQTRALAAETAKAADAEMRVLARKMGMSYEQTDLVSAEELSNLPGIGGATEPAPEGRNEFDTAPVVSIVEQVFSDERLYQPMRAQDPFTQNMYVHWKVEEVPAHTPALTDPGIKDLVVNRWKLDQARPLAEKRAKELAAKVKANQPLSQAFEKMTVSGQKGLAIAVLTTNEFTWMSESTAPSPNPMAPKPPPQLSSITFVEKAGMDFMETVFDKLQAGQTGVAPNDDRSIYYVARVIDREPSDKELEILRLQFYNERTRLFGPDFGGFRFFSTPYQDLAMREQQTTIYEWMRGLEKKYGVEWTDPDDAPI